MGSESKGREGKGRELRNGMERQEKGRVIGVI